MSKLDNIFAQATHAVSDFNFGEAGKLTGPAVRIADELEAELLNFS
jgi:hypothetical protein